MDCLRPTGLELRRLGIGKKRRGPEIVRELRGLEIVKELRGLGIVREWRIDRELAVLPDD